MAIHRTNFVLRVLKNRAPKLETFEEIVEAVEKVFHDIRLGKFQTFPTSEPPQILMAVRWDVYWFMVKAIEREPKTPERKKLIKDLLGYLKANPDPLSDYVTYEEAPE